MLFLRIACQRVLGNSALSCPEGFTTTAGQAICPLIICARSIAHCHGQSPRKYTLHDPHPPSSIHDSTIATCVLARPAAVPVEEARARLLTRPISAAELPVLPPVQGPLPHKGAQDSASGNRPDHVRQEPSLWKGEITVWLRVRSRQPGD